MIKILATLALAAGLATAAHAQSDAGTDTFSARVRAGDLNLASPGGLATFHGRVRAAADAYCGVAPTFPLAENRAISRCREALVRSADAQVSLAVSRTETAVVGTR